MEPVKPTDQKPQVPCPLHIQIFCMRQGQAPAKLLFKRSAKDTSSLSQLNTAQNQFSILVAYHIKFNGQGFFALWSVFSLYSSIYFGTLIYFASYIYFLYYNYTRGYTTTINGICIKL